MPNFRGEPAHSPLGTQRPPRLIVSSLLAALSVAVGYFLASTLLVADAQDAYQYRFNLDRGVYFDERYDTTLFALLVRSIVTLLPDADPFIVMGTFICATYFYLALRSGASWYKVAAFMILLVLPLMEFNYTQVVRQGMANALILLAIFSPALPIAAVFLIIGGTMHLTYAPFAAVIFVRMHLFRSSQDISAFRSKGEVRFDRIVVLSVPLLWALLSAYQDLIFPEERVDIYITYEANLFKRLSVSVAMIGIAWLIYPKTRGALASLMVYATISVAIVLPFTYDFLRMQTYVMPFILFAALLCRDDRRSLIALGVCLAISLYVQPNF